MANIPEYWGDLSGGEPNAGGEFNNIRAGGFLLKMLGLCILLLVSTSLGVTYLRANVSPRWFARLLVLAGPGGVLLLALRVLSGTMLLCLAWTSKGYALRSSATRATERIATVR